ncbi:hypothetical protein [Mangrovihabitans endophyticus]|uniref:Alpha-L-arabinofuranosidase 1 catalytic domain-containing protein n=1 Tax=Mangrovihabitans endophyticus TaxID=1751298 RepID=A0A8J3BU68_9ACTN|nr:hypothetical protein [Mangrovihabitans endophyticus]GGK78839.1 hypothetical protein GCM10012284_10960 [Mangrovihabitans endophyticus]
MRRIDRRRLLWGAAAVSTGAAGVGVTYTAAASEAPKPSVAGASAAGASASPDQAMSAATGSAGPLPVITVDARTVKAAVSSGITGVNGSKWYDDSFGMWDRDKHRVRPEVVAKFKRAGIGLFRYPGGTSANLFHWKRAVGPQSQRSRQVNGLESADPVDSRFGPDEWMPLVEQLGAELTIMAPFASTDPQDIADWVQYMNGPRGTTFGDLRAKHGHPQPYGVRYWEIGNEHYVGHERYWMSSDTQTALQQYAFGGTQRQKGQRVGARDDHRPQAGVSTGKAGQQFTVHYPPVVPRSQVIKVDGTAWTECKDLSAAGRQARVYTFNPANGAVKFGDGTHGAIPRKGAVITADYDSGPHAGFVDYYKAMKAVDPSIQVIATWAPVGRGVLHPGKTFPQIMAEHGHAEHYDGLAVHPYTSVVRDLGITKFPNRIAGHHAQMIGDGASRDAVVALQAEVKKYGKPSAYVVVSESGALFFGDNHDASAYREWTWAMSHALYEASQWSHFLNRGLRWAIANAPISTRSGVTRAMLGGPSHFVFSAEATVRELLKPVVHGGGHVVATDTQNNLVVDSGLTTPVGGTYHALVTTATVDRAGGLNLVVVNRSPDKAVQARLALNGYAPSGKVSLAVVSGARYDSFNDVGHLNDVTIHRTTAKASTLTHTFGAHSVTVLRFAK